MIAALRANPRVTVRVEGHAEGRPLGERANRRVEIFELAMMEEEQVRWVCGGRAEPVTTPTKASP